MEELEFNPFAEKLNVGLAIQEIGPNKEIKLMFDKKCQFMISSKKGDYFPADQGALETWDYETSLTLKKEDCGDWDWPKYAAEDLISEIVDQMKRNGLRLL
jgi:hypothetical protein